MTSFRFRSCILPAAQAVLTGTSTFMGVILVILWRPRRVRDVPFYSDASHNDPERVILAIGENLACFFMPLVAIAEYLHQSRLAASTGVQRPTVPRALRWIVPSNMSLQSVLLWNFIFTLSTTVFFFVTSNVPSKRPFTPPHQMAASGLIFSYSVQSTLKAILAATFKNYRYDSVLYSMEISSSESGRCIVRKSSDCSSFCRAWEKHHLQLRLILTHMLWFSLIATWLCYMGRLLAKSLGLRHAQTIRSLLATSMALVVYLATSSCVVLMVIMAIDMRHDWIVLRSENVVPVESRMNAQDKSVCTTDTLDGINQD